MGFVKLSCPSCGASITLDENNEVGFCSYCGTKIVQDKIVVEHRGRIAVDGITSEKALLQRGFLFVEDSKYDQASQYFEKVLDLNPYSAKAYLGKLLCQLKYKSIDVLIKTAPLPLSNYGYFQKVKRFAKADEIAGFESIENAVLSRLKKVEKKYNDDITSSQKKINAINNYLEKNKSDYAKRLAKGTGLTLLSIVLIIILIIDITCCIVEISEAETSLAIICILLIIGLPFLVGSILLFKRIKSNKDFIKKYNKAKTDILTEKDIIKAKKAELSEWENKQKEIVPEANHSFNNAFSIVGYYNAQ